MDAERGRLRGAPVERIGREAGPLVLVRRREPARKREQLRLQVRGDDANVAVARSHSHLQAAAAHLVHQARTIGSGRVVADLDRQEAAGERPDVDAAVQRSPAQERHPDPALVRLSRPAGTASAA